MIAAPDMPNNTGSNRITATPKLPEETGNTQMQLLLHGSRRGKNGQPVATPISTDPSGALKISLAGGTGYFDGVYTFTPGDLLIFAEGKLVAVFNAVGQNVPPIARPPTPF